MKFHIDKFYRLKSGYVTLVYHCNEQPEDKQSLQISLGGKSINIKDVFPDDLLEMSEAMMELYKRLIEHRPIDKEPTTKVDFDKKKQHFLRNPS